MVGLPRGHHSDGMHNRTVLVVLQTQEVDLRKEYR
jgi:hypothetical protein